MIHKSENEKRKSRTIRMNKKEYNELLQLKEILGCRYESENSKICDS